MKTGLTGNVAHNVRCGTVDWKGNRLSGCGRLTETMERVEAVPGYTGLWTTTHLCADCTLPEYLIGVIWSDGETTVETRRAASPGAILEAVESNLKAAGALKFVERITVEAVE